MVFCGKNFKRIFECINGVLSITQPFKYPYTIIPLLCGDEKVGIDLLKKFLLLDKFIIGIQSNMIDDLYTLPTKGVVIINVDSSEIIGGEDINSFFPKGVLEKMYLSLQKKLPKPGQKFETNEISGMFLKFMVDVFGTYRYFVKEKKKNNNKKSENESETPGGDKEWEFKEKEFIEANHSNTKNFLNDFFKSESYKVWARERIEMKKKGMYKICQFEFECSKIIPKFYGIDTYKTAPKKSKSKIGFVKRIFGRGDKKKQKKIEKRNLKKPRGIIQSPASPMMDGNMKKIKSSDSILVLNAPKDSEESIKKLRNLDKSFDYFHKNLKPEQILEGNLLDFGSNSSKRSEGGSSQSKKNEFDDILKKQSKLLNLEDDEDDGEDDDEVLDNLYKELKGFDKK